MAAPAAVAVLLLGATMRHAAAVGYEYELIAWRGACGNIDCCSVNMTGDATFNPGGHMSGNTGEDCRAACDAKAACLGYSFGNHRCVLVSTDPADYGATGDIGAAPGSGCHRKLTTARRLTGEPSAPTPLPTTAQQADL
mmetsp:Transcript_5049/g.14851  ORF Transcript_5049/g.14851 Transcript_5049/m.14851 type:complete len:139 (+) Transcript_5049:105-521(+)